MEEELGTIGGDGLGPFGNTDFSAAGAGLTAISKIVSSIVGILTIAGGIWFLFQLLIGGLNWISSGGDKTKLQNARDRITNGLIGLVVLVAGVAILSLAGQFFGFDFLLSDPETLDRQLTPEL